MDASDTHGTHLRVIDTSLGRIVVPFGYPLRHVDAIHDSNGRVQVTQNARRINLKDRRKIIVSPSSDAILYPYFNKTYSTHTGIKVNVRTVIELQDRFECQRLPHYLRWPSGLYVLAEVDGKIVGTVVLARLSPHMRPSWRRELENEWNQNYVEAIWIRRVSVRKDFEALGIGNALAKAAVEIGQRYWLPKPNLVELISKYNDHRFLIRAGFKLSPIGRRGRLSILTKDGSIEPRMETRFYYWRKI